MCVTLQKEKQEGFQFLLDEVQRLPVTRPTSIQSAVQIYSCIGAHRVVGFQATTTLPSWGLAGVNMIWRLFDEDQDGELTDLEWMQLKDKLNATHGDIDELLGLEPPLKNQPRSPQLLLSLYEGSDGAATLQRDLRTFGIHFGSDELLAAALANCSEKLAQCAQDAQVRVESSLSSHLIRTERAELRDQAFQAECTKLQSEVHEKVRANTRLRDALASTKASLDSKDAEIARTQQQHKLTDAQFRGASEKAGELSRKCQKAEKDLVAVTNAVVDMRALVEDQVNEKEKWQRYCWELEERLHEAMHTSKAKERDLWKTRDAKKEEARKNMLLYMDAHRGKRHYCDPVSEPTASESSTSPRAQSNSNDIQKNFMRSDEKALEMRRVAGVNPVV